MTYEPTDTDFAEVAVRYDVTTAALHTAWDRWVEDVKQYRSVMYEGELVRVAEGISPHNPESLIRSTIISYRRAAAMHWAFAGHHRPSDVLRWFDENTTDRGHEPTVDMGALAKAFPIELPRDDKGLIDLTNEKVKEDDLQRALIYDQMAEVNYAMTWGGDDNWFDYLPDGMAILRHLQDEMWKLTFNFVLNNMHTFGMTERDNGDADYDEDASEAIYETWQKAHDERRIDDMSFQDVVSSLIYALADEHPGNATLYV